MAHTLTASDIERMAETRTVASPDLVARVRALDREHGTAKAAALLGVGRATVARVLAGLGVRRGTIALVEGALEKKDGGKNLATPSG